MVTGSWGCANATPSFDVARRWRETATWLASVSVPMATRGARCISNTFHVPSPTLDREAGVTARHTSMAVGRREPPWAACSQAGPGNKGEDHSATTNAPPLGVSAPLKKGRSFTCRLRGRAVSRVALQRCGIRFAYNAGNETPHTASIDT